MDNMCIPPSAKQRPQYRRRYRLDPRRVVFFGQLDAAASPSSTHCSSHAEMMQRLRSGIEFAIDTHRRDLAVSMRSLSHMRASLDAVDAATPRYRATHDRLRSSIDGVSAAWEANEAVVNALTTTSDFELNIAIEPAPTKAQDIQEHSCSSREHAAGLPPMDKGHGEEGLYTVGAASSYNSVNQLLHHLARDWSMGDGSSGTLASHSDMCHGSSGVTTVEGGMGRCVRMALYDEGILPAVRFHANHIIAAATSTTTSSSTDSASSGGRARLRVLVPGAGMCRLAAELAAEGFDVEANEASGMMVASVNNILLRLASRLALRDKGTGAGDDTTPPEDSTSSSDGNSSNSGEFSRDSSSIFSIYPLVLYPLADDWDFDARLCAQHIGLDDGICARHDNYMNSENSSGRSGSGSTSSRDDCTLHATAASSGVSKLSAWLGSILTDSSDCLKNGEGQSIDADETVEHANPCTHAHSDSSVWGRLVVQMGDFVSLYSAPSRAGSVDMVVTSFFIDTAPESIIAYIGIIAHVLAPGGVWINAGPLHYHKPSVTPYSYTYIRSLILESGFDDAARPCSDYSAETSAPSADHACANSGPRKTIRTDYCGETQYSMKPEQYNVPLDAFRKRTVPSVGADSKAHTPLSISEASCVLKAIRGLRLQDEREEGRGADTISNTSSNSGASSRYLVCGT